MAINTIVLKAGASNASGSSYTLNVSGDQSKKWKGYTNIQGAAHVGDTVTESSTGWVYKCTKAGKIQNTSLLSWAEFSRESAKAVLYKPAGSVDKMTTPARGSGLTFSVKWAVPKNNNANTNWARWDAIWGTWSAGGVVETIKLGPTATSSSIDLADWATDKKGNLNRNSWYPNTKNKITGIGLTVWGRNEIGEGFRKQTSVGIKVPRKPTISLGFNASTGIVSATIKTNAGTDLQERYDTRYNFRVYNSGSLNPFYSSCSSTTSTDFSLSWDASGYQSLGYSNYYRVEVEAWARGLAGDSGKVTRNYYVSYPAKTTVTSRSVAKLKDGSWDVSGQVVFNIKTNATTEHPVDVVSLQYLRSVPYKKAEEIPADGEVQWEDSGITDNGTCTAMAVATGDVVPQAGTCTWVRIKSWHGSEAVLYRYSDYIRLTELETPAPTAADEEIKVVSAESASPTSVAVKLGWDKDGTDDADGTELTWSLEADSWKSTEPPTAFTFGWSDGELVDGTTTWGQSAEVIIKELEEGLPVYIRARRFKNGDDDTVTYSPYSNTFMFMPAGDMSSLEATVPRYLPRDSDMEVSWSYGSYAYQTEWQVVNKTDYNSIIASGNGTATATRIPYLRWLTSMPTSGTMDVAVRVSTGAGFMESDPKTVSLVDPPTISNVTAPTLTAQPCSIQVTCATEADLALTVIADGVTGIDAVGLRRQATGEVVHSGVYSPVWARYSGSYRCTVQLPGGLDFRDGGTYQVLVEATDSTTGLKSEYETTFAVEWSHQAPAPSATIEPITEEGGIRAYKASIVLGTPSEAVSGDVCDVYRLGGTAVLVAEGIPMGATLVDDHAPFGDVLLRYRVAVRTADGDIAWDDFEYELPGSSLRLDWDGRSIELPYNLVVSDSYAKDVEVRQHLDGSRDAYWNSGVARTASLSTAVLRIIDPDSVEAVRELARWAGSVFVRTPYGQAYEADVQVESLSASNGVIAEVALNATEVGATGAFAVPYDTEG